MKQNRIKKSKKKPAFVARAERAIHRVATNVRANYRSQHVEIAVWDSPNKPVKKSQRS